MVHIVDYHHRRHLIDLCACGALHHLQWHHGRRAQGGDQSRLLPRARSAATHQGRRHLVHCTLGPRDWRQGLYSRRLHQGCHGQGLCAAKRHRDHHHTQGDRPRRQQEVLLCGACHQWHSRERLQQRNRGDKGGVEHRGSCGHCCHRRDRDWLHGQLEECARGRALQAERVQEHPHQGDWLDHAARRGLLWGDPGHVHERRVWQAAGVSRRLHASVGLVWREPRVCRRHYRPCALRRRGLAHHTLS